MIPILVLHYNKENLTNKCVDCIEKNTPAGEYELCVIDNGSQIPYSRNGHLIHRIPENAGFTRGMNEGLKLYLNHEYIIFLCNDVFVEENWLAIAIKTMEANPTCGILVFSQHNEITGQTIAVGADFVGGVCYANYSMDPIEIVWGQFAAVMFRTEMIREIGLPDKQFVNVCSDSDYCLTANERGWKVVHSPHIKCIHLGNATFLGECETSGDDRKKLLNKWTGLNFNKYLEKIPLVAGKQRAQVKVNIWTESS